MNAYPPSSPNIRAVRQNLVKYPLRSSLNFFVYTFTHTTNWVKFHEVKQDVLLKIEQIIREHGAEIAFPTSTLHIPAAVAIQETATG